MEYQVKLDNSKLIKTAHYNHNIDSIEKGTVIELQKYIYECLRQTSPSTGKLIHINPTHWRKAECLNLIRRAGYEKDCLKYLNTYYHTNVTVFEYRG